MDLSVSDAPVGRLLDGRYRIEALVARGGMATVYKATDTRLDRPVALKIMHAELAADDDFVARFIGEARAVAQLSDPNVVNVFDQGEDDGAVYLAMEYIHGRTLRDVLHERGRLGADLALEVAESVLSALASAHRAGIVHRDVKPENVLVGNDGRVKVADFGLARANSSSSKTTRGLLGTVSYISPEQALGERATPRSDVYSAGIMLYELLTGKTPHEGPTDFVVVRSHIDDDVPPPSESVPLPPAVDALVLTATAREPMERYADASAFLNAIRSARAAIAGAPLPEPDDDPELTAAHAEPRDSAGVTVDEALAGTVLAGQVGQVGRAEPDDPGPPDDDGDADGEDATAEDRWAGEDSHPGSTRLIDAPLSIRFTADDTGEEQAVAAAPAGTRAARQAEARARTSSHRRTEQARSRRGLYLFLFVLLLAIGVATAAWWYGSGRWESTPSLLGLTAEQAEARADDSGFNAVNGGEQYSESVEAGQVVSTDPAPGERLLGGAEITYVLSLGPERYEVPELVGQTVDQANELAAPLSMTVRVEDEVYHDEVEAGLILTQSIEPGEQVRRDTEVVVTVSRGPQPVEIEDFTGRSGEEAQAALAEAGFTVNRQEQTSEDVEAGLVISQDPASGTGFRNDEITIIVSSGPELIEVPNVRGERVERAEEILREAGFVPEAVDLFPEFGSSGRGDRVQNQEPAAGEQLPRGSTVRIIYF
ncbi:Stk1 family PASTA domain-containing Ser/Thr kinase [Jiangella sp. DSM 45060]|uniref:Stk1 family PASTA domain-containing Ser/Thr kinase n=1 Tax=Jiangella sp. DSM 45060 TaxID=1798224 RepID=UPI00087D6FC6|nr:Stk1 family PASTA domain-containing Ser/Thr kinase [Jiangella sp. DSM 45060]SDT28161.1 serine/threonine protein kinase [Jiangella sp. DSM 45060]